MGNHEVDGKDEEQLIVGKENTGRTWRTVPGKEGIIYREHTTRKHGRKPDRFLAMRYRNGQGSRLVETLGWASSGWTVDKAFSILNELKENIRKGERPQSLKEKRSMLAAAKDQEAILASRARLKNITFGELAALYEEWAIKNRVSAPHVSQLLETHILPTLGPRVAADVTPLDVEALRRELEQKRPASGRGKNDANARLSTGTVMHALKTVREVYNFALETCAPGDPSTMLFSGQNPARMSRRGRGVRPPQKDSRRLRILNDEEIKMLFDYKGVRAEFSELHDMILLSLDTGLRAGELVHLKREAVDSVNGTLRILKGSAADRSTKGGLARLVHVGGLHSECLVMLKRRMTELSASPYLFPGGDGTGMRDMNGLNRAMRRIMEKLKFNDGVVDPRNMVVWHTLRHTYATRMLEAGCDIYMLKELMGHASVTTTEGYLHLCDRAKRELALAMVAVKRRSAAAEQVKNTKTVEEQ